MPVHDDCRWFEFLILEGAQARKLGCGGEWGHPSSSTRAKGANKLLHLSKVDGTCVSPLPEGQDAGTGSLSWLGGHRQP